MLLKKCSKCGRELPLSEFSKDKSGKEGWQVIGCNRIDNSKPHTMDNVEPCCLECNRNKYFDEIRKKVYQCTLDGKLVKIWNSVNETQNVGGFLNSNVWKCIKGKYKKHKGFKWMYKEEYEKMLEDLASQQLN